MKLLRLCLMVNAMLAVPGAALAQTDYSAGKSAPQLFSSDCSACHQSPQGLAKGRDASTLGSFLREHYTTGGASAGLLANYLAGQGPGRQPAARRSPTPDATATAPAGGSPRPPAALEAERTKPGEARKPKPTATEAEPAKPAAAQEPAKPTAVDPLSTKLRGYATTGEPAIPVAAAPPEDAARAIPTPAPANEGRGADVKPAPMESGSNSAPSVAEPTPATPAQPGEPSQSARPPG
jgi:hypothetical protein